VAARDVFLRCLLRLRDKRRLTHELPFSPREKVAVRSAAGWGGRHGL